MGNTRSELALRSDQNHINHLNKRNHSSDFIFYKLNAEGDEKITYLGKKYTAAELAALFEVSGYPTTVFLEPNGKVIEYKYNDQKMNNLPGYYKAGDFKKVLEFILDGKYKDTDMKTII